MRIADALSMYENADAREDGYKHRVKAKAHRRDRAERQALREARKEAQNA